MVGTHSSSAASGFGIAAPVARISEARFALSSKPNRHAMIPDPTNAAKPQTTTTIAINARRWLRCRCRPPPSSTGEVSTTKVSVGAAETVSGEGGEIPALGPLVSTCRVGRVWNSVSVV